MSTIPKLIFGLFVCFFQPPYPIGGNFLKFFWSFNYDALNSKSVTKTNTYSILYIKKKFNCAHGILGDIKTHSGIGERSRDARCTHFFMVPTKTCSTMENTTYLILGFILRTSDREKTSKKKFNKH